MVATNYRVDLFLVKADVADMTKMQTRINQWITAGTLVKYQSSVVGNQILFEVCRVKPTGDEVDMGKL